MPGPARKFDWPAIKDAYVRGATSSQIASQFGLSKRRINDVAKREQWEQTSALADAFREEMKCIGKDCPESRAKIIEILEQGGSRSMAAGAVGVHRHTLTNWTERDPTLEALMIAAESRSLMAPIKSVTQAASNGTWQAGSWLLERHRLTRNDYRPYQTPPRQLQQGVSAIQINIGTVERSKAQVTVVPRETIAVTDES